jgi:2'-5' RNA ligase
MSRLVRSFVAATVSDGARSQTAALLAELRGMALPGVRWVGPEQMHLTLAFLGEVTQEFIEAARGALASAVAGVRAFDAQLGGLGAFPSLGRARVVWVGMKQGRDGVVHLQREVVRALAGVGYVPEARLFSLHLTLGRLREPADVTTVEAVRFESERFRIDRVVLFQSVLRPEGPVYTRLSESRLAD